MGVKRGIVEAVVSMLSTFADAHACVEPKSIFVLRNNDIGDLLVITPLFEALRRLFPKSEIVVGIGKWNLPVVDGNPNIDRALSINAPWHNKNCCTFAHNSARGFFESMRYILASREVEALRRCRFDVGIDVLGSVEGSVLLMKAGIPFRLGVKGYAGGHSAMQRCVPFSADEHVGRSSLRFAELLGARILPECRPQIFLSSKERLEGEASWSPRVKKSRRIVIGPGGGNAEKCWPRDNFIHLIRQLAELPCVEIAIVGGRGDRAAGAECAKGAPNVNNRAGDFSLRQTFATVACADLVVCNSSMLMHAAAAFSIPEIVMLGEGFPSAEQHARQWGYESNCWICGKAADRDSIWSPSEVLELIASMAVRPTGEMSAF